MFALLDGQVGITQRPDDLWTAHIVRIMIDPAGDLDPHSGVPLHRQLAALLRARIIAGEWRRWLPSEKRIGQEYDLGRNTVREAIASLRTEGLIVVERGRGTRVRQEAEPQMVDADPGSVVWARSPTPAERREYGMPDGVPMLVVEAPDGLQDAYPAHAYRVRVPPSL